MTAIRVRRGTAATWASRNPVLQQGEPGLDTTNGIFKLGDGITPWATLPALFSATSGLSVREGGAAAKMGSSTLVAGTVTVATTAVTASTRIFLSVQTAAGTAGLLAISARVAGTSFTITSSAGTDTSTVAWLLIEPA